MEYSPERMSTGVYLTLGPDIASFAASRNAYEKETVLVKEIAATPAWWQKLASLAKKLVRSSEECKELLQTVESAKSHG